MSFFEACNIFVLFMRQSSVEIKNSFNPENDAWNFESLSIIQVVTFWILTAFNKILIQIELGCGKTLIYNEYLDSM